MSVTLTPVFSEVSSGGNVAFKVGENAVGNLRDSESDALGVMTPSVDGSIHQPRGTVITDSPTLASDDEDETDDDDSSDNDKSPDKDESTPGFGDDLDDADDDLDEFDDIDEDDFDDDFDDDFEEELDDDYEIEIDDEISAEFGLNTAGEDLTEDDDDLDDFDDFEAID